MLRNILIWIDLISLHQPYALERINRSIPFYRSHCEKQGTPALHRGNDFSLEAMPINEEKDQNHSPRRVFIYFPCGRGKCKNIFELLHARIRPSGQKQSSANHNFQTLHHLSLRSRNEEALPFAFVSFSHRSHGLHGHVVSTPVPAERLYGHQEPLAEEALVRITRLSNYGGSACYFTNTLRKAPSNV